LDSSVLLRHNLLGDSGIGHVFATQKVKKRSKEAFPVTIKILDALHLSAALIFQKARPDESLLIFSYNMGMNRCAKSLGFTVPFE